MSAYTSIHKSWLPTQKKSTEQLTNAEGGCPGLADQTSVVQQGESVLDAPVTDKVKVGGEEEAVHVVDLGQPDWHLGSLEHAAHL